MKLYRADWRHVVQTVEDDAQYVGINDYKNKCHSSDVYYRACKHLEKEFNAAKSELTALKAELASEEQDHAELRDVVAALREELAATKKESMYKHTALEAKAKALTAAEQRNATLVALLQRVVDSSVLSFEADAPEELESLEVDICAALGVVDAKD